MSHELIVVKQLPIIEEQLLQIKEHIQVKVTDALSLAVTEDTVKTIKEVRAELNRDFNSLEGKRKEVKKAILTPYDQFEAIYKECVTDLFKPADEQLKAKIAEVENGLKEQRRAEVEIFFEEYAASKGVDFVTFERSGITVTLSVSKKALKDQARVFVDKLVDELALIDTQEHKAEILVEYKKSLNVAAAITSVAERMKAIEDERARVATKQKFAEEQAAAARNIDSIVEAEKTASAVAAPLAAPVVEPGGDVEPAAEGMGMPKVYEVLFSVTGTIEQLKTLKTFLTEGGYSYVSK